MKIIGGNFLRGKVSRRIFFTVLLCAAIPIASLVFLTFYNVYNSTAESTSDRLRYVGKNIGMLMVAELVASANDLQRLASQVDLHSSLDVTSDLRVLVADEKTQRLTSARFFDPQMAHHDFQPRYRQEIEDRLNSGFPMLEVSGTGADVVLILWTTVHDSHGRRGVGVGRISNAYLWRAAEEFLPGDALLTITNQRNQPIFVDSPDIPITDGLIPQDLNGRNFLFAEIAKADDSLLIGFWDLFMQAQFNADAWRIFVAEPRSTAFADIVLFQRNAGLTALLAFWIILLAASILVRQILHPLKQLKEATGKIGRGDYGCNVKVTSQDEFQMLAESFNLMTGRIQHQVLRHKQMGEAVQNILSSEGRSRIVTAFQHGIGSASTVSWGHLLLVDQSADAPADVWHCNGTKAGEPELNPVIGLSSDEIIRLVQLPDRYAEITRQTFPGLFQHIINADIDTCFCFRAKSGDSGTAFLLVDGRDVVDEDERVSVRLLVDQLGIAMNRSNMVSELRELNIGILTALARTVDANSRWTHGHSERVTEYAIEIAREMGFGQEQRDNLRRAGLLHDLGKVAVPSSILNKPGKLSAEEYACIKEHPAEAARIIEPIAAFSSIRKIIHQHHERWDGKGYPDGLQGEDIEVGARILAVADVFDALYSDRPYRPGWSFEKVVTHIQEGSGNAFDPVVVSAFLNIHKQIAA